MGIRSLEELRRADERTLRFTSLGLATGGKLRPEDAAVYQQEVISHAELVPAVAEGTRNTFERLRWLHAYGVLSYNIFTAAEDLSHLVIEQALRDRFVEFYEEVVPFEDARGVVHEVTAATFYRALRAAATSAKMLTAIASCARAAARGVNPSLCLVLLNQRCSCWV